MPDNHCQYLPNIPYYELIVFDVFLGYLFDDLPGQILFLQQTKYVPTYI